MVNERRGTNGTVWVSEIQQAKGETKVELVGSDKNTSTVSQGHKAATNIDLAMSLRPQSEGCCLGLTDSDTPLEGQWSCWSGMTVCCQAIGHDASMRTRMGP